MRRCPGKRVLRNRDWVKASHKRPTLTPRVLSRIRICSITHKYTVLVSELMRSNILFGIHHLRCRIYRPEGLYIGFYTVSRSVGTRNNDKGDQLKKGSCFYKHPISPWHELPKWPRARLAIGDDISSTPTPRNIRPVSPPPTRHARLFSTTSQHTSSLVLPVTTFGPV